MNKGILALFGATLLILMMAGMLGGIISFRSTSQTSTYDTTTVAGQTSANCTLPLGVLDDNVAHVTSVTSNLTADAPLASSYASHVLNITGLIASNTRRLTVIYRYPSLGDYNAGVDIIAKWWPLFLAFGIIGIVIAAVVKAFGDRD